MTEIAMTLRVTFILMVLIEEGVTNDISKCRKALGMQSGNIIDEWISASSSYDHGNVGPHTARSKNLLISADTWNVCNAPNGIHVIPVWPQATKLSDANLWEYIAEHLGNRIRTEKNGGAWCPKPLIGKGVYEWLKIDLSKVMKITLVETQGRFGNGQGQEFVEWYMLDYQREDDSSWVRYRNKKKEEIFKGNSNTYMAEMRHVNPPIVAKRIRFIPYSKHPRTVCLRVELYGCQWKESVISYTMPQGDRRGTSLDLSDFTYDGSEEKGILQGGLGQLIDGELGKTNFRLDVDRTGRKAYEWVGWKNDSSAKKPIEITFTFDDVRNFSTVTLHCNNLYTKDIRVFRRAELWFSIGGEYYNSTPVIYDYMRDTLLQFAREVVIVIPHNVGKFCKIRLYFDARWIMISEVKFESEPVTHLVAAESGGLGTILESDIGRKSHYNTIHEATSISAHPSFDFIYVISATARGNHVVSAADTAPIPDKIIGIIIGGLAAIVLLLFLVVIIVFVRHRRKKFASNSSLGGEKKGEIGFSLNSQYTAMFNGKLAEGNVYKMIPAEDDKKLDESHAQSNSLTKMENRENEDAEHGGIYDAPWDSHVQDRSLPDLPTEATPIAAKNVASSSIAEYSDVPDVTKPMATFVATFRKSDSLPAGQVSIVRGTGGAPTCSPIMGRPRQSSTQHSTLPPITTITEASPTIFQDHNSLYAATDIINLSDNTSNEATFSPTEIPRENLKQLEVLGSLATGEVHLCEAVGLLSDGAAPSNGRPTPVVLKLLHSNATDATRAEFFSEIKLMSRIDDVNIVRVIGVCTHAEPIAVVLEYPRNGDLHSFLNRHTWDDRPRDPLYDFRPITHASLVYMATQITSGMKYLENKNMVHRDLACRNVLVGEDFHVKVCDLGMCRPKFQHHYYRHQGKATLPVRWMAWESVLLSKFTSKSDVWAFAVTMWELLTLARSRPLDHMTDEDVILNCGHYYQNNGNEVALTPPEYCPREIYDLLRECVSRDESSRPSFREIHMFLSRKNMGYNPRQMDRIV